jgi:hypothetical protein
VEWVAAVRVTAVEGAAAVVMAMAAAVAAAIPVAANRVCALASRPGVLATVLAAVVTPAILAAAPT